MEDLIEPIAAEKGTRRSKSAGGTEAGIGTLRPKRARITGTRS
jgi:hypothetical protein